MVQNYYNNMNYSQMPMQQQSPMGANAVSINIIAPQAYATNPYNGQAPYSYIPMYGPNPQNMPIYPANYNNMFNNQNYNAVGNQQPQVQTQSKVAEPKEEPKQEKAEKSETEKTDKKDEKTKTKVPLTDDYIKSLENYLDDDNPKVRLIAAKDVMERFKEDGNRKDNKSLIPLLNKILQDTNSAVRFLGLTTLNLGYSVGNDETVQILKQIQTNTENAVGEDNLLASEILLKMAGGVPVEVKDETSKGDAK